MLSDLAIIICVGFVCATAMMIVAIIAGDVK